ncbi:MAG: amidase [Calditrichaceae bacterium]|nr:amidase [Calditrichaceae bacterium]
MTNKKNEMNPTDAYDLNSVRMPDLSGTVLELFVAVLESPLGSLLIPGLLKNAGVVKLRKQHFDEAPTNFPLYFTGTLATETSAVSVTEWPVTSKTGLEFKFASAWDFTEAYQTKTISPEQVAEKLLAAIENSDQSNPPLRAFININRDEVLKQARESATRYKKGKALGPLDGVPVAVKDEVDMIPYPTTVGTAFLGQSPAIEDATAVARLRSAGALLIGKTNMHEIGIGVTGLNPHYGTVRNPYNPAHYTGGSSSGSAAAVAAGLCPIALGADGGGSVRIPAALCGMVGLKATYGRISEFGAAPLDWSVAHIGPIAANVSDLALGYATIAGPDPKDPNSLHQPVPTLNGWDNSNIKGLKIGVYWPWFRHASREIVAACQNLLEQFKGSGAQINEVVIPDLEAGRVAHLISIAGEMAQAMEQYHDEHHKEHGLDVRINLTLARAFTLLDYVKAQRVRTRMINHFKNAFEKVDVIVTPSTGLAAPFIPNTALPNGDSDLSTLTELMRFTTPANLTGLPAISFPAGYTDSGLPIGMQAIGRPWDEVTLMRLALAAERLIEKKAPFVHFNIL